MGVSSAMTAGLGVYNMIKGAKEQKDAQNALENYDRQQLNNAYENMQVSTLGSDVQRAEQARLASTQVDALAGGGARALVSGLGRVESGNQNVNLKIGADLDQQQKAIAEAQAQDDARIRAMQENREQNDINALSSQYQSGKQDMNMGLGNIVQGFGSMQNQYNYNKYLNGLNPNPSIPQAQQLQSVGNNTIANGMNAPLMPNQNTQNGNYGGIPYQPFVGPNFNGIPQRRPAWMNYIPTL